MYADDFVRTQGLAALKQIVARYPYESEDGNSLILFERSSFIIFVSNNLI